MNKKNKLFTLHNIHSLNSAYEMSICYKNLNSFKLTSEVDKFFSSYSMINNMNSAFQLSKNFKCMETLKSVSHYINEINVMSSYAIYKENTINSAFQLSNDFKCMGGVKGITNSILSMKDTYKKMLPVLDSLMYVSKFSYVTLDKNNNGYSISKHLDIVGKTFSEYAYMLPLKIPVSKLFKLHNNIKNEKPEKKSKLLDKYLLECFSQNKWDYVVCIVNDLKNNKNIKVGRIHILEECVKVLKKQSRKTSSTVLLPTLITQIEGVWTDILNCNSCEKKRKLLDLQNKYKMDNYVIESSSLLTDNFFKFTKYDNDNISRNNSFNRNKILHGEILNYCSIYNIIRAFLVLEFLNSLSTIFYIEEKVS